MPIAKTVKQYLDNKHVIYDVLDVPNFRSPLEAAGLAGIAPRALYYPVILRDPFGLLMAILPASHKLDFQRLSASLHRTVEPAFQTQLSSVFADCQPGLIPPLGEPYSIRTIIDASLSTPEDVYIVAGDHARLIKLRRKDFMLMQVNAWLGSDFATPVERAPLVDQTGAANESDQSHFIRQRVEQITELPPMPEMARRLFELRAAPDSSAEMLVKVVELDPSLAAQVLRYANSPYFGYPAKVDSLQVAIVRVLGFDMVMNLAMGLALLQSFKIPRHGMLGLDAFWKHAVYSANLMQMLCKAMPKGNQPRLSTCYLIGLLHDFGYLVLGHLFRDEFLGLNDRLKAGNEEERIAIERDYLGIDHSQLGHWLLKAWGLPDEIVVAAREHHAGQYHGLFGVYVQMIRLTDYLLRVHDSGQTIYDDLPDGALKSLGLNQSDVIRVMVQLLEQDEHLETMARQLAA
jgi:HD-like signal output (HDOD) protein/prolyl-tRNA editing enzyme YbaK/EbsC (Cys-tRNA(Pro) deacylase)